MRIFVTSGKVGRAVKKKKKIMRFRKEKKKKILRCRTTVTAIGGTKAIRQTGPGGQTDHLH